MDRLLIKQNHMSRQENALNKQGTATTTTPSRLARTNPNHIQRQLNNPTIPVESSQIEEEESKLKLLPNKVSALDKNILFQDVDRNKNSSNQSANSSRTTNVPASNPPQTDKAIGLISNVFLGATSRFVKGAINNVTTPTKVEQIQQEQQDTSKVTLAKFSRNREVQPKARTISMREPTQEAALATDRSGTEAAKKIERRQGANRETRELKFTEKKEEKVQDTPEKAPPTVVSARKTETFKVQVKTEVVKTEQAPSQEPVLRVYQPIQRQTPYGRSRIVSEHPPVQNQPVVEQKPKEQPKPATNRLVQSRLQSQLAQSKTTTEKEVKPAVTITVNKTSESRLLTEVAPPAPVVQVESIQPKQQIKPKPFSRSFINKKPAEPEIQQKNLSNVNVVSQSTVIETSVTKTSQQSRITDTKAKSQVKQAPPETSQVKLLLKKSGCIALIGKRLVRSRLLEGFSLLKSHKQADKIKKVNECLILCCSMVSITKLKEGNSIKLAFENIKKKFTASYLPSLKSFADEIPSNHKNAVANMLDRLYFSKMRQSFRVIKLNLDKFKNKTKCVGTFEAFLRQKIRQQTKKSFDAIKLRQKNLTYLLTQLSNITSNVNKAKLITAFSKIASIKPASSKIEASPVKQPPQRSRVSSKIEEPPAVVNTSNQALVEKLEKLKKASSVLQGEIGGLEATLQKKKKGAEGQKGSLVERVTVLKQQNEQANNEIEIKKHRNGQIKKEMENIPPKDLRGLEEELAVPRDSKLEVLTNIYISNFKNPQESVSTEELLNTFSLKAEDGSVLFHEWAAILRNVELKRIIAAYEGVDPRENKGRTSILGEQALVTRLIRSYVKEQYFWQWIHLSAQNS